VPPRWHPRYTPPAGGRPPLRRRQREAPGPPPEVAATVGESPLALRHELRNGQRHSHQRKRARHLWREPLPRDAPRCARRPHSLNSMACPTDEELSASAWDAASHADALSCSRVGHVWSNLDEQHLDLGATATYLQTRRPDRVDGHRGTVTPAIIAQSEEYVWTLQSTIRICDGVSQLTRERRLHCP